MKKRYGCLAAALILALLAGGCGAKMSKTEEAVSQTAAYDTAASTYASEPAAEAPMEMAEEEAVAEEGGGIASTTGIDSVEATGQKLIKTVGMSVETKEFDTLLENLRQKVEEIGGYIESSDISGSSYYSVSGNRYAWFSLRIPADKLDGFVTIVGEMGNVTNKHESVQDITLQYVDVESHKKALLTEQERLMALLEKAESMEDIIAIESRLSQVRYELQSYESTLRTYDNQVNYSTVSLDVCEVERETNTAEKRSFFEEIKYRLSDNFYSIGQDLRSFAIWFISSLPYLVIWAVVIVIAVKLALRLMRKKPLFGKKKKKMEEDTPKEK